LINHEVFSNPPIVEALMDIRVQLDEKTDIKGLSTLQDPIKERYNQIKEQFIYSGTFKLDKDPAIESSKPTIRGFMFNSEKEKKVVQSRIDGFTFSKLKPYENWDIFFSEGQSLFKSYLEIAKPISIFRIGLRFINRIEVPMGFLDFNEYILTNPQIAPGIPQAVSNFFLRVEIPNIDNQSKAIVSVTMDKITSNNKLPLMLDIDVFHEYEYISSPEVMWEKFISLREFKNDIFFNTVTEKCKELFI